jgi:5-methylcytosine-specific restriction protein B
MADEPPRPVVESPLPVAAAVVSGYTADDFTRETFLGKDWLHRACELLALKKQLILQGVPGTGKTHVARCLARLLTAGRDESIRLVQFHPGLQLRGVRGGHSGFAPWTSTAGIK